MFISAISESLITIGGFAGLVGAGRRGVPFGFGFDFDVPVVSRDIPGMPCIPGMGGMAGGLFAGADCAETADATTKHAATTQRIPRAVLLSC